MSFTVLLHPKAVKELEKIGSPIKERIIERLKDLKDDPERGGKILKYSTFWRLKVGNYRAIYEIDRTQNHVLVLFIGHRKKVYHDFSKLF